MMLELELEDEHVKIKDEFDQHEDEDQFYRNVEVDIQDIKTSAQSLKECEKYIFLIEGIQCDLVQFKVTCQSEITLKSLEIKYNNKLAQKKDVNLLVDNDRTIFFSFFWTNLEDFHISDVFEVLIACEEVSCQFTFKIKLEIDVRLEFNDQIPDFPVDVKVCSSIEELFKNNFQSIQYNHSEDGELLKKLKNYHKMSMEKKNASKQLFEMLGYAVMIEKLQEFKDNESFELKYVKLKKLERKRTENYFELQEEEHYKFFYNRKQLKNLKAKMDDYRLEIWLSVQYEKFPPMKFSIEDCDFTTIKFKTTEVFDEKRRYHINIVLNENMSFGKCLNSLALLKYYGMADFFNCFEYEYLEDAIEKEPSKKFIKDSKRNEGKSYTTKQIEADSKTAQNTETSKIKLQELQYYNRRIESNPEQMLAVQKILGKEAFPYPFVVFGPPGTGKTSVIVESVAQIIKDDANARILITAQSNSACDEIGVRLLQYIPRGKIYRHYSKKCGEKRDKIPAELLEISNLRGGTFRDSITVDEFYHFNIIIVTLMSSTKIVDTNIIDGVRKNFNYIFIDECGAATEPEVLIPITEFGMEKFKFSNLILLGDHKQLGPIVKSEYAEKLGLGVSLLERIMETKHYKEDGSKYKVQLLDNYRSHPKILAVPNKLFYDSKLRSKISKEEAEFAVGWRLLPNKKIPMILHSTVGNCVSDDLSYSFFNNEEINVVKSYVDSLLEFGINGKEVYEKDIGIVTPYRAQLKWLKRTFHDKRDIEIGTTELYQGREKKIIIMTTVKSGRFSIGFLANEKRLNVMLTRAKCLMIVVCNPKILQRDPHWRKFIEFCVENKVCAGTKIKLSEKVENFEANKKKSFTSSKRTNHVEKFDFGSAENSNQKRKAEKIEGKSDEENIHNKVVKRVKMISESERLKSKSLENISNINVEENAANPQINRQRQPEKSPNLLSKLDPAIKTTFYRNESNIKSKDSADEDQYSKSSKKELDPNNKVFDPIPDGSTKISLEKCEIDGKGNSKGHQATIRISDSTSAIRSQSKTTAALNIERSRDLGSSKIPIRQNYLKNSNCSRMTLSRLKLPASSREKCDLENSKVPVLNEGDNLKNEDLRKYLTRKRQSVLEERINLSNS